MELILLSIIVIQFAYLAWQDYRNRKEREKLEMMIMSKDVTEYKEATEPTPPPAKVEEETNVSLDDVPVEVLIRAKDHI